MHRFSAEFLEVVVLLWILTEMGYLNSVLSSSGRVQAEDAPVSGGGLRFGSSLLNFVILIRLVWFSCEISDFFVENFRGM